MMAQSSAPAARRASAASHGEVDWHAIDWRRVHQNVRRLQARIVKATQEGRWGRVKVSWPISTSVRARPFGTTRSRCPHWLVQGTLRTTANAGHRVDEE